MQMKTPELMLSGGQTGVDRTALDCAMSLGIAHGGWCPRGRTAHDGPLPQQYQLQETEASGYSQRTRMNVRDADATLIIHLGPLTGGTLLTQRFVEELNKPTFSVDLGQDWPAQVSLFHAWWTRLDLRYLNVAGPSEERTPGIYAQTMEFLRHIFR